MAQGLVAGGVTVTATSEGKTGTAPLTVTSSPPVSGSWSNEPSGMSLISDYGFSDPIPITNNDTQIGSSGWIATNNSATMKSDGTAPLSASSVADFTYPTGMQSGTAPGTIWRGVGGQKQLYVGFWWKVSNPWQGDGSGVNKIAFFWVGNSATYLAMYGSPGGPFELNFLTEFSGQTPTWIRPTVSHPVTLGSWHKVEAYLDANAGMYHWWIDGIKLGDVSYPIPTGGFTQFSFSPTWGGMGDTKRETDYYRFDHVHLSAK
jgi:hypothetical protein